jgi:hypothetical protein
MPEWTKYIRQNLRLHGLRPERDEEIIEDLAQQLEDAYREALAGGMAEADAAAFARQHVPDWDALNGELQRLPRGAAPALELSRRAPIPPPAAAAGGRPSAAFSGTWSSACA